MLRRAPRSMTEHAVGPSPRPTRENWQPSTSHRTPTGTEPQALQSAYRNTVEKTMRRN